MKFEVFKKAFFKGTTNKNELIQHVKTIILDYESLRKFITRIEREISSARNLCSNLILGINYLPKNYNDLNKEEMQFYSESLEQEMNWQTLAFVRCYKEINTFLKYKDSFEHSLLLGEYENARIILDKIETDICVSFWSIENRLVLDEYELGSEKNWETRNYFLDNKNDGFVRIFGDLYSLKTEKRVSFFQYNDAVDRWFEKQGMDIESKKNGQMDFFRFKSNYFSSLNYSSPSHVLYFEGRASIIDRYLLFIRIAQHLTLNKRNENNFFLKLFHELYNVIDDVALSQLLLVYDDNFIFDESFVKCEIINIIDSYTKGMYSVAAEKSKKFLVKQESFNLELVEIFAKSLIETNSPFEPLTPNDSILNQIAKLYFDILNKGSNSDISYMELMKLSYAFSNTGIGIHLFAFINSDLGWLNDVEYSFMAALNSKFLNPRLSNYTYNFPLITASIFNNYSIRNIESVTSRLFEDFYINYKEGTIIKQYDYVSNIKNLVYQARSLKFMEDYSGSIAGYSKLELSNALSIISEYEIRSSLFSSHLLINDYRQALILNVEAHLMNPHLTKRMNVDKLLHEIIKGKFKNVGNIKTLIELPIFFKINCNDKIKVKQTYQLFLNANNSNKPSELIVNSGNFERENFIYFLNHVCIPEIMQLSKSFDSTYAVNEERIIICKFLAEFDSDSIKLYKNEIAELTQKNTISKVIGGIDERKVFVNENKIRDNIRRIDKQNVFQNDQISPLTIESFERYLKLLDYVKDNRIYRNVSSILEFGDNGEINYIEPEENKIYSSPNIIYLPVLRIFISFFIYIRDLFIFSKEYGLDAYLSTRIRHGTLPNHLRSVFETYSLVTSQTDSIYTENAFWGDKIYLSSEKMEKLQKVFADFSLSVDSFSKDIKDKYIQCSNGRKNSDDAMFNFFYSEEQLIYLFLQDFKDIQNIEEFIDKCFSELWKRAENCLENIRKKMNVEFKDKYVSLIDNLQNEILCLTNRTSVPELVNSIMTCKTEMQTKLNNISKWFRRSESSYEGEYDLLILVETSIQITKNIHPNYHFEMEYDICPNFNIKGEYHQHFIDLMNNFLFNIIKHSNLQCEDLNAKLTISEDSNMLNLNFENCVSDIFTHQDKLTDVKNNWSLSDRNVSQEGGTGFPKIKKIINSDLNRSESHFNFEIQSNKLLISLAFETKDLRI